ncbi:MAG TPA: CBS domain-containing protein [Anaerolineales bacterium]|nr:CBS domain-containing protein [Anaerolineales bacterium]
MLIKERMKYPVITVKPDMPIMDTLNLMKRESIRRTPVVDGHGKLVGIVSDKDLLNAGPSDATSLSVWEVNYLLSKIKVEDIMTRDVITVHEDTPVEEAAYIMASNKIGGLPVTRDGAVVGIITETDLFKIFLELLGARDPGVRLTAIIPEKIGELADVTRVIAQEGGNVVALGTFFGEESTNRILTIKVEGVTEERLRTLVEPYVIKVTDLRTCC